MNTRNLDTYRGHANEAINAPEGPLPPALQELADTATESAVHAKNLLKLSMYAGKIHSVSSLNPVSLTQAARWIDENTLQTQVFLNELWASIPEDGIRTDKMNQDITKYLGIPFMTNSVSSWATIIEPVPAPASVSPITIPAAAPASPTWAPAIQNTDFALDPTRAYAEVSSEWLIPDVFKRTPEVMAQLKLLEKHGIIVNGDRAIIENPQAMKLFQRYTDVLNFIHHVPRESEDSEIQWLENKTKLMDNYVFLINEGSDFMTESIKTVLAYKYAEAIYNDVIRMGSIIESQGYQAEWEDASWNPVPAQAEWYYIRKLSDGNEDTDNPYNRVLLDANTRNLIDVARVSSMVRKNFALNEKKLVGDAPLVAHILKQHAILDPSGKRIQKAQFLLLNKAHVLNEIDGRIKAQRNANKLSPQSYQELSFLKEYVERAEVPRQNYMKSVLKQVNLYKSFLWDKALISGDFNIAEFNTATEKGKAEMIADAVRNNRWSALILGIILWIMGKKNLAAAAIGVGLLGNTIADGIESIWWGIENLTDEDLDIVKISDITYTIDNSKFQGGYEKIADLNRKNIATIYDPSNNQKLPTLDNVLLFDITNAIASNALNIQIQDSNSETAKDLVGWLSGKLDSKGQVFSESDLETYVELLKVSWLKEGSDETVLDYLLDGADILSKEYSSDDYNFTTSGQFDTALHEQFWALWIWADREKRENYLMLFEKTEELLYSGAGDETKTQWEKANGVFEKLWAAIKWWFNGVDTQQQIQRVWELKNYVRSDSSIPTRWDIVQILENYELLLQKQDEFADVSHNWYDKDSAGNKYAWTTADDWLEYLSITEQWSPIDNLYAIQDSIVDKQEKLREIKLAVNNTPLLFWDFIELIEKEEEYLTWIYAKIEKELDAWSGIADAPSRLGTSAENIAELRWLRKVLTQTHRVENSLKGSTDELKAGLSFNFQRHITDFYIKAKKEGINGVNATATVGVGLWESMQDFFKLTVNSIPYSNLVVWTLQLQSLPQADIVIFDDSTIDTRTIEDIESQIKLAMIDTYLRGIEENAKKLAELKAIYEPILNEKVTTTDAAGNSIEDYRLNTTRHQELRSRIGAERDELITTIQSKITEFASTYRWQAVAETISQLDPTATKDLTKLWNFETVQRFLATTDGNTNTQIANIRNSAQAVLWDNSFLDYILPTHSSLKQAFQTELDSLRANVELPAFMQVEQNKTPEYTVVEVNKNIEILKRLRDILGIPTTILDNKITEWNSKFDAIATLGDIAGLKDAMNHDKNRLQNEVNALRGIRTPNQAQLDELHEKSSLLGKLQTLSNNNNTLVKSLQTDLTRYSPVNGSGRAYNRSYYPTTYSILNP